MTCLYAGRLLTVAVTKTLPYQSCKFYSCNSKVLSAFTQKKLVPLPIFTIQAKKSTLAAPKGFHENISALQTKKRLGRKKKIIDDTEEKLPGVFYSIAFSSAEEYNLEQITLALKANNLYEPKLLPDLKEPLEDVVYASAKYQVGKEPRDIFFFREGTVVFWNCSDLEYSNVLGILKPYEIDSYNEEIVLEESEVMNYKYTNENNAFLQKDSFHLTQPNNVLEKFTFSNAMALSVKLGIWESSLESYIDSIEFITEDLKKGNKIKLTREQVLRKHGELLALRHLINLSSDLLDTPDFYWERDDLEKLYLQTCTYFSISKRTKVMNEKLNHCFELLDLLESHLSDKNHIRLEWMIIVLIMVEVGFEVLHYLDRYSNMTYDAIDDKSTH